MLIGYARVSTEDQNLDRQIDQLINAGVKEENIYQEKSTGTTRKREVLEKMLNELEPESTIIVSDLTRISRSTRDLLEIIDTIKAKQANIKSIKDTWLDTTSDNPYNSFLLTVMSGLSQLERDLISQRTREGLKAAKARGKKGGRPRKQNDLSETILTLYNGGQRIVDIMNLTKLSRSTINRIIRSSGNTTDNRRTREKSKIPTVPLREGSKPGQQVILDEDMNIAEER